MHDDLADGVDVVLEVLARADDEVLADLVESLRGDRLEGASHDWVVLEHRVELIDGQREQTAVRLGAHARHTTRVRQQTDLCRTQAASSHVLLAPDVIYASRAYATRPVSVCLSVCL